MFIQNNRENPDTIRFTPEKLYDLFEVSYLVGSPETEQALYDARQRFFEKYELGHREPTLLEALRFEALSRKVVIELPFSLEVAKGLEAMNKHLLERSIKRYETDNARVAPTKSLGRTQLKASVSVINSHK